MIPTGRLVLLLALPLILGGVALAVPGAVVPLVAADVVILLVAVVDASLNRGAVTVHREVEPVQAVGRSFPVTLELRGGGHRRLDLRVVDDAPGSVEGLPVRLRLAPGRVRRVVYRATVDQRGEHAFGPVTLRWRSPLGLFERQVRRELPDPVRVYPRFRHTRGWGVTAREDEQRAPQRVRRQPGGESEFERLRPYVRGDSYRHIDWRATARHDALVTRQFGQESNQNVLFLIDAGRMMSAPSDGITAFDRALDAAVTMGQAALRHGDRVGLMVYDDRVRAWLPPRGGARSGSRLIRATYDLFPSLREPDHAMALQWLSQRVKQRSLVVLLTAVVDTVNAEAVEAITGAMAGRHLPLCVWIRDPELERLVTDPRPDREATFVAGAAAELLAEREHHLKRLRDRGALVLDADPAGLTPRLMARYLEVKARRLL